MKIAIYGAGYVGLVSAVCFAELGHTVICSDLESSRIALLKQVICPFYEVGLQDLLQAHLASERLQFVTDNQFAASQSTVHFIAVGTPSLPSGEADLSQVFNVCQQVADAVCEESILIIKSTVPVGTSDQVEILVKDTMLKRSKFVQLLIGSNPEFLREGSAVADFLEAERIVVGGDTNVLNALKKIYEPLINKGIPFLAMDRRSAELAKYAANAMLACRVSFINQISQLAEKTGANIDGVCAVMGSDSRIGSQFLQAGIGYGGSCFPKDVRALIHMAQSEKLPIPMLQAIESINQMQKNWIYQQLIAHTNSQLKGLVIAIWGVAFKPNTDDLREASALVTIHLLLEAGAKLRIYDPVAMPAAQELLKNASQITWCQRAEDVFLEDVAALVIATEWDEFKQFPLDRLSQLLGEGVLIDGRNCFNLEAVKKASLTYYSVGRTKGGIVNAN